MSIQSFRDLEVWQKAMELAEEVYRLTKDFPQEELFGLTSQMRQAATSVPANIAEGWARRGTREFLQFLNIASGSLRELETYLHLAPRIKLTTQEQVEPLLDLAQTLGKQLIALQRSLQAKSK
ncbi:MAG: four helix bundle protein [Chloroflexi bacterium]|nr:four helix bundle protein [Chloroflexota bacterium]